MQEYSNIKKNTTKLFLLALSVKIGLALAAFIFANLITENSFYQIKPLPNFSFSDIFKIYYNSDSGWYQNISLYGYNGIPLDINKEWIFKDQHFAFFPLLPYSIMFVMYLTGLSFYASAFIINIVVLYFLVYYFYLFLQNINFNVQTSYRLVVLFLIFPFSLHLYFIYTESLFFTLLVACFYYIQLKKYGAFTIAAILLTLTRPNGLFMALPLYLYMLEQDGKISINSIIQSLKQAKTYCLAAMPLAFVAWMYYQYITCGDWFAFSTAQKGWGKHSGMPYKALFKEGYWQYQFMSAYAIVFILIAIWAIRKWRVSFNFLVWINILMPLIAGSAISMARYIAVLFPFNLLLAKAVNNTKTYKILFLFFIIGTLVCFYFWLQGDALMY